MDLEERAEEILALVDVPWQKMGLFPTILNYEFDTSLVQLQGTDRPSVSLHTDKRAFWDCMQLSLLLEHKILNENALGQQVITAITVDSEREGAAQNYLTIFPYSQGLFRELLPFISCDDQFSPEQQDTIRGLLEKYGGVQVDATCWYRLARRNIGHFISQFPLKIGTNSNEVLNNEPKPAFKDYNKALKCRFDEGQINFPFGANGRILAATKPYKTRGFENSWLDTYMGFRYSGEVSTNTYSYSLPLNLELYLRDESGKCQKTEKHLILLEVPSQSKLLLALTMLDYNNDEAGREEVYYVNLMKRLIERKVIRVGYFPEGSTVGTLCSSKPHEDLKDKVGNKYGRLFEKTLVEHYRPLLKFMCSLPASPDIVMEEAKAA